MTAVYAYEVEDTLAFIRFSASDGFAEARWELVTSLKMHGPTMLVYKRCKTKNKTTSDQRPTFKREDSSRTLLTALLDAFEHGPSRYMRRAQKPPKALL